MDIQLVSFTVKSHNYMKEINELKARAYDIISALEQLREELKQVNDAIYQKVSEYKTANESHERGNSDLIN